MGFCQNFRLFVALTPRLIYSMYNSVRSKIFAVSATPENSSLATHIRNDGKPYPSASSGERPRGGYPAVRRHKRSIVGASIKPEPDECFGCFF